MAKKAAGNGNGGKKAMSKGEIFATIADQTELNKKQVRSVFESLSGIIAKQIKKGGPGSFVLPGLAKIVVKRIPARPAKKGVPNPFKPGELMNVAAKPARNVVKIRPMKALKDMV